MRSANHLSQVGILAFVAGTAVSFFTLPIWVTAAINIAKEGNRSDWLGFFGSIIGAAMTLIAAVIAWFSVQRQIAKSEDAKHQSQQEAKTVAIVVLAKGVHAASALLFSAQIASAANTPASINHWDDLVKQVSFQLTAMLDHFTVRQIASEMEVNDRIFFLMVVLQLHTIISIYNSQFGSVKREARLEIMESQLWGLEQYLPRFDEELWKVFKRDASLPGVP